MIWLLFTSNPPVDIFSCSFVDYTNYATEIEIEKLKSAGTAEIREIYNHTEAFLKIVQ